jgi:hypothetical protein
MITKILLVFAALAAGTVFLLPKQLDISGTWAMNSNGADCEAAVIRVQFGEGYYFATLDVPGQRVYDKPIKVQIKKDSIKLTLDDKGDCFIQAVISGETMTGRSIVDGLSQDVSFSRVKK